MKSSFQVALLVLAFAACTPAPPPVHYGFLAKLGNDTVSIESVSRSGNTVVSDEVDRFPRVRTRHTVITLDSTGAIRNLVMDIETPSEPANERNRHVTAEVTNDTVHLTKKDETGTKNYSFATGGTLAMAHIPQMYSLTDLYFQAALKRADATKLPAGDSIHIRQFYIDREFDRFPLHSGYVKPTGVNKAEIQHDWLAGYGDATFDSAHNMLTYNGARSTYKIEVTRLTDSVNVAPIGKQFAALEASNGMKQLSVRDTVRAAIGAATFVIDYSRPLARGRTLLGNIIEYNNVWRTGANAATQFTTSAPTTIAGIKVPAGSYTLWTFPREKSVDIIINKETGQWGTSYDRSHDLGEKPMTAETVATPVEKFTLSIVATDAKHGSLVMEWGTFRWAAPVVVD
ncbi:MAG: DUF2911 domain-containing protein [Gemmatimonadaceae bacterium]